MYKVNSQKPSRKAHILDADGKTLCKAENGSWKLDATVETLDGREVCKICKCLQGRTSRKDRKPRSKQRRNSLPAGKPGKGFYSTWKWHKTRYRILKLYGRQCMLCGTSRNLSVDHIKPLRLYPELALELDNLQVLCGACNRGKSNWDETDWRTDEQRALLRDHDRMAVVFTELDDDDRQGAKLN